MTERVAARDTLRPGSALFVLAEAAAAIGANEILRDTQDLAARVTEGRFYLTCLGQFKRGKSTLLNALVGDPVLPTGVAPVTSVVTILRFGRKRSAQVRLAHEGWCAIDPATLAEYVTEAGNPENARHVEAVEVYLPSPLLEDGMCLVDTPGIGSVFESGSLATRRFVPHVDAALVVLGADPPLSGDELGLVKEVARNVRELIFVLNKADRMPEKDRAEALAFTRRVLEEHVNHPVQAIHEISATEVIGGRGADWDWDNLVGRLTTLAREGGAALVHGAEVRGRALLAGRLTCEIREQREAILRPLEESEKRIEVIRRSVEDADRSLHDLSYLLNAEHDRLATTLRTRQKEFVASVMPKAIGEFREELAGLDEHRKTRLRNRALDLMRDLTDRWLERWRREQQPFAEAEYRRAADRFIALGNEFLRRLRATGLEGLPTELSPELGFRTKSGLFYTSLLEYAPLTAGTWVLDRLRTKDATRRAVQEAGEEYLEQLLFTNTSRIANTLIDQALESRRRLEAEIRSLIRNVLTTAERALARARTMQAEGSRAVEAEITRLDALARRVESSDESRGGGTGHDRDYFD